MNFSKIFIIVFIMLITLNSCVRKAEKSMYVPAPKDKIVYRDISYVTNGHERQKLDLYVPRSKNKLPLIIWVHGGAWLAGSKNDFVPLDYLSYGYAVASINYRLSQHALFPAQIEDCKAAVRWLRANAENYNLDPNKFGAWGASAGGHLAALLGTTSDVTSFETGQHLNESSAVQAVVDYFGPTDFLQMEQHRVPGSMHHNTPDSPESLLVGGPVKEKKEIVAKANPINYVTPNDAPFLIIHGEADPLVPHYQSQILASSLKKAGVPVIFYTVKGGGHGGFDDDPNVSQMTKEFLAKHLKSSTR
jgi:acetyl esterase/lipase